MFKKLVVAAALAALASSAFAADAKGFYGGLDVGMNKVDNLDGSKIGLGTFLGYSFNQYVALELGYRQLGEWHVNGGTVKLSETHVSVVGSYPLNSQFDIYGRLGHDNPHGRHSRYGARRRRRRYFAAAHCADAHRNSADHDERRDERESFGNLR